MQQPKKLPIGIQTFRDIRDPQEGFVYVDKTEMCYKLLTQGKYYFLSRPRRFGKSLFLDTLSEILKGRKELFEGLYIQDKWQWEQSFPVIRIDFSGGNYSSESMILESLNSLIDSNARDFEIGELPPRGENIGIRFATIIAEIYRKTNKKVAILVDEYDKPILDNLSQGNKETAAIARELLKRFFSALKPSDAYLKFVFLTGVSKFSKLNLFSGANNIEDITIDSRFATIAGYTHDDLKKHFPMYVSGLDLEEIKLWYNGYNFLGEPVYNPYDILLFFAKGDGFKNHWWQTGNPAFLIEKLKEKPEPLPQLENAWVTENNLNAFDIESIDIRALLWQTGYLTFAKQETIAGKTRYKMKVPNLEVQDALNSLFLDYLTGIRYEKEELQFAAASALLNADTENLRLQMEKLFASIPYQNYVRNNIGEFEGFYASVVYAFLASLGFRIVAEDTTNRGRIDMTVLGQNGIFIFEFKVDTPAEAALKQIKEKKYYSKYIEQGKEIYLIGIHFGSQEKNITEFLVEKLSDCEFDW